MSNENVKHNRDGGSTTYYDFFTMCTDVDSVHDVHKLTPYEFNVLKALVGIVNSRGGNGVRHGGTSALRDAKKMLHYSSKIVNELERESK